jgi:hypothetical protein
MYNLFKGYQWYCNAVFNGFTVTFDFPAEISDIIDINGGGIYFNCCC